MTLQQEQLKKTIQVHEDQSSIIDAGFLLQIAGVADSLEPWGRNFLARDVQLRQFWPTETFLASALYSTSIRNAAFSWTLEGPPETVAKMQDMLTMSDFGQGWQSLNVKLMIDLFSQENGAFMEIIRQTDSEDSPTVGLAHLDAGQCRRTGNPEFPVNYFDDRGSIHRLAWYQVAMFTEFPSPIKRLNGMQLCAVGRILRAAQILRDISIYKREKIAGDNPNAIYLVGNVQSSVISDAVEQHKQRQSERGMTRYVVPLIVGGLDPSQPVTVQEIALKSLPDGFDEEVAFRWYVTQLALAFGSDYQDFAPLPGRGIGSSAEALVLHMKSRGRGPASWMSMMEYTMNYKGIMPSNVLFRYDEQDTAAEREDADLDKTKAETIKLLVDSGTITEEASTQMALDEGVISNEVFSIATMGQEDVTTDVVAQDTEPVEATKKRHPRRRRRKRDKKPYKQVEVEDELADFGEDLRVDIEEEFALAVQGVLASKMDEIRSTFLETKSRLPFARKQADPRDILADTAFWSAFRADMLEAVLPVVREGASSTINFTASLGLPVDVDVTTGAIADLTRTYSNEWWDALETRTREGLRASIIAWEEGGLGTRGLPDLVSSIEPLFGPARAGRIAVTEVTQIFDESSRIAQSAAGIQEQEWQTARDSRVDDICAALNGQRFPIDGGPRPVKDTHIG